MRHLLHERKQMPQIKTAISLERETLHAIDQVAREMNLSRSRVVVLAIQEYLKKLENNRLIDQINTAYEDQPDPEESMVISEMKSTYRQTIEPW